MVRGSLHSWSTSSSGRAASVCRCGLIYRGLLPLQKSVTSHRLSSPLWPGSNINSWEQWSTIKKQDGPGSDCSNSANIGECQSSTKPYSSADFKALLSVKCVCVCVCIHSYCCLVAQLFPTLCDPMDCSPPASSVHGISQVRILKWVAISFSRGSSQLRDWTPVSCIGRQILYHWATREAHTYLYTQTCMCVHVHIYTYTCRCVCVCVGA